MEYNLANLDKREEGMDYHSALNYLHSFYRFGGQLGLERLRRLLELLGNPQEGLKIIHVAGTNGKGSVTAMVARSLEAAGYRVGRYTSPHLEEFTERMSINGRDIAPERVAELVERIQPVVEQVLTEGYPPPTEFEVITAVAFLYFWEERVDFVSLEVGLGGTYDATNVVREPLVTVITSIGLDHTERLGDTLVKIAGEKAGIIKTGAQVVTSAQPPEVLAVIREVAASRGCAVWLAAPDGFTTPWSDWAGVVTWVERESTLLGQVVDLRGPFGEWPAVELSLVGRHQQQNAATAVAALEALRRQGIALSVEAIRTGLATTSWPGRLEIVGKKPLLILDGAHNPDGARVLARAIRELFPPGRLILVTGLVTGKASAEIFAELLPLVQHVIITRASTPRAADPLSLLEEVRRFGVPADAVPDLEEALARALLLAGPDDIVLVAGSLYLVGDLRALLRRKGMIKNDFLRQGL